MEENRIMPKPKLEFFPTDDIPWVPIERSPPGHYQNILTEDPERMFVTRMLKVGSRRFASGGQRDLGKGRYNACEGATPGF